MTTHLQNITFTAKIPLPMLIVRVEEVNADFTIFETLQLKSLNDETGAILTDNGEKFILTYENGYLSPNKIAFLVYYKYIRPSNLRKWMLQYNIKTTNLGIYIVSVYDHDEIDHHGYDNYDWSEMSRWNKSGFGKNVEREKARYEAHNFKYTTEHYVMVDNYGTEHYMFGLYARYRENRELFELQSLLISVACILQDHEDPLQSTTLGGKEISKNMVEIYDAVNGKDNFW